MNLIGFDFSINKPAACIKKNNEYHFFGWPYELQKRLPGLYNDAGIHVIDRIDDKEKGTNISDKMRYEVKNSQYLSDLIFNSIKSFLTKDTYIEIGRAHV